MRSIVVFNCIYYYNLTSDLKPKLDNIIYCLKSVSNNIININLSIGKNRFILVTQAKVSLGEFEPRQILIRQQWNRRRYTRRKVTESRSGYCTQMENLCDVKNESVLFLYKYFHSVQYTQIRKLVEYLQLQVDERRLGCLEKHLSGEKKYILEKCLRKPDESNLAAKLVISFLY